MIINSEQLSKILHDRIRAGINEQDESYQAIELLPEILLEFPGQIRPEIISDRFYQTELACYLETTIDEYEEKGITPILVDLEVDESHEAYSPGDYRINRMSLSFMASEEGPFYLPEKTIEENANHFLVSPDGWTLINTTDLFTNEAAISISENYQSKLHKEDQ
jgi:hypothetical protein